MPINNRIFRSYFKTAIVSLYSICLLIPSVSWTEQNSIDYNNQIKSVCSGHLSSTSIFKSDFKSDFNSTSNSKFRPNLILEDFNPHYFLLNLGLNPKKVRFFFIKEFHFENEAILVQMQHDGHTLAQMTLIQNDNIASVWHTDLTLLYDDNFKGKGLGVFMYLVAAAKFYKDYPDFELHGSANQSEDAKKLWLRLIKSDFAERIKVSRTELGDLSNHIRIRKEKLGQKLKDYIEPYVVLTPMD